MMYKSYKLLCLVIGGFVTACSQSDWEELQFTEAGPQSYIVTNSDDDGFIIRDGLLVASSEKLLTVLDSGVTYPYELYLSCDSKIVKYVGRTNQWYKHRSILLVSDLGLLLSVHPDLVGGFSCASEIALVIKDNNSKDKLIYYKVNTIGADRILRLEKLIN